MAFPGEYNISYYKGDTYEFRIYPKDASGNTFDLTDYSVAFTIATARGSAATQFTCYAAKSADNTYLTCAIRPADGEQLSAGTTYVYDVQITDPDTSEVDQPYDRVYTVLTGNVTIRDHVTGAV